MSITVKSCNKTSLLKQLNHLSRNTVINTTYEVIISNRKCDLDTAKRVKKLFKNEVKAVLIAVGELE